MDFALAGKAFCVLSLLTVGTIASMCACVWISCSIKRLMEALGVEEGLAELVASMTGVIMLLSIVVGLIG